MNELPEFFGDVVVRGTMTPVEGGAPAHTLESNIIKIVPDPCVITAESHMENLWLEAER